LRNFADRRDLETVSRNLQAPRAKKSPQEIYPAVARKDFFLHPASEVFKL